MTNCPNCGITMKEVLAPEHYGQGQIKLEQCEKCGGLWFDNGEFYRVRIGEATELEKIDLNKLSEISDIAKTDLPCPRDGHTLTLFKDPYFFEQKFLKNFKILTCPTCGGFWFNRGEFTIYQAERAQEKITEKGTLAQSILQLEDYKKQLTQNEGLQTILRSPGASDLLTIGDKNTGDWRLDILFDIIGAILRRIFM